jgi:hypothetical protein
MIVIGSVKYSSATMQPGSFPPMMPSAAPQTGIAKRVNAAQIPVCNPAPETCMTPHAMGSPTKVPTVPGITGLNPVPKPTAIHLIKFFMPISI